MSILLAWTGVAVSVFAFFFASPASGETLYGVHQDLTYDGNAERRAQHVGMAQQLGAQVSRNSLLWSQVEPTVGIRDWTGYDAVVDELRAADMQIDFTIYGSPTWANGVSGGIGDATRYVPIGTGPEFKTWVGRYSDFIHAAVRRYGSSVRYWEIGNEENEPDFWKPYPDVEQYAIWYRTIRRAILEEDPGAEVAVGGLAGLNAGCCITGKNFLKGLVERDVPIDNVALHPYPSDDRGPAEHDRWLDNFDDVAMINDYLASVGERSSIWITEWGWSSSTIGEVTQAQYVKQSLEMVRDEYPFVKLATMFIDADRPPEYDQGMFDTSGAMKPAGQVFAAFTRNLSEPPPPADPPNEAPAPEVTPPPDPPEESAHTDLPGGDSQRALRKCMPRRVGVAARHLVVRLRCPRTMASAFDVRVQGLLRQGVAATGFRKTILRGGSSRAISLRIRHRARRRLVPGKSSGLLRLQQRQMADSVQFTKRVRFVRGG